MHCNILNAVPWSDSYLQRDFHAQQNAEYSTGKYSASQFAALVTKSKLRKRQHYVLPITVNQNVFSGFPMHLLSCMQWKMVGNRQKWSKIALLICRTGEARPARGCRACWPSAKTSRWTSLAEPPPRAPGAIEEQETEEERSKSETAFFCHRL